uniref:Uncharacterized protein n=1 Tax=Rhizophora mucronata TaxID=61149 RepID=A0A2P2PI12_RHIMU
MRQQPQWDKIGTISSSF